jgi:hypothetical protein
MKRQYKGSLVVIIGLITTSLISSCSKDSQQVEPAATSSTEVPTNSMKGSFTSHALTTTYTSHSPISYYSKSNITISGLSINGGTNGIALYNCSNVHITNCKVYNTSSFGIMLNNCTNVTVDWCYVTNAKSGVHVYKGSGIKVNNNQFYNMNGPFPDGCFVQFAGVTGGGNQINYNKCQDDAWHGHPQDGISLYQSYGKLGDSIQVFGNQIKGGQVQFDSGGAAGIVLGDVGGAYQVARWNKVVNSGYVGMQVVGGNNIKMDHNLIYSSSTPVSNTGINVGNYSGQSMWNINVSHNWIRWYQRTGSEWDLWLDKVATPAGWSTNIPKASIGATIVSSPLITMN